MRERTTWNRDQITASATKKADDPRAMNQDHHAQQPSADKYVIGDPSDFAEDVHPSAGTWKQEYSGGEVKRNEIGMPEMRGDTYNHPEKTASLDEETLLKKSNLCVKVARMMLPKSASQLIVEDQAFELMKLPDADLMSTHNRLASVNASQQDDAEDEEEESGQQQSKQAKDLPPEFLKNIEKKKEEAKDKGDDGDDDKKQQSKEAKDANEDEAKDEEPKEQQSKEAALLKAAQDQMQQMAQQLNQMQAQMQQMMQQGATAIQAQPQQQQQAQCDMMGDDQLLEQMLQGQMGDQQVYAADDSEIQLEGANLDVGETVFTAGEEDALQGLFSQDQEYQMALHAAQLQGHMPASAPVTAGVRTASSRTVGTRPTHGVAQLGGATSGGVGSDVDKLSNLWQSAPDVSGVFRS